MRVVKNSLAPVIDALKTLIAAISDDTFVSQVGNPKIWHDDDWYDFYIVSGSGVDARRRLLEVHEAISTVCDAFGLEGTYNDWRSCDHVSHEDLNKSWQEAGIALKKLLTLSAIDDHYVDRVAVNAALEGLIHTFGNLRGLREQTAVNAGLIPADTVLDEQGD
jgi:hypothetical protein